MKILPNIPNFAKLIYELRWLEGCKKDIEAAKASGDREAEREHILKATTLWSNSLMKKFGCHIEIEGEENIPEHGPVVIMSNHQSNCDILAMLAVFQKFQIGFVAKDSLSKIPLYGEWIRRIRSVFIERDDPRASLEAINRGVEYINEGYSLVIFPEGTRSQCSTPNPFLKGPVKLATKPGVPIIPVSLDGTYKMFEETGIIKPTTFKMIIHKPIETAGISRKEEKELSAAIEKIIVDGVNKLHGED
ncbi:MAG: lysophospholipid acyltransferase family protein [Firmicutes bacterium]|nr:lysophospholipid acyltransferase family protein [Bacillota bacterium]